MTDVACFMVRRLDRAAVVLRRYAWATAEDRCVDGQTYHNAEVRIGEIPYISEWNGWGGPPSSANATVAKDDPRWPTVCDRCGSPFADGDEWQENHERFWRADDGREWGGIYRLPPGAMFFGDWAPNARVKPALFVSLPPNGGHNVWCIDGPSTGENPGYWDRTGVPPNVTATPSILTHNYHGWLRDGILVEC